MEQLVSIEELQARVPFEMGVDEIREATAALIDLSDDARFYGSSAWSTPEVTPQAVKNLILRAAARFMKNPDGYVQSRAGDEMLAWSDQGEDAGSAFFTRRERAALEAITGRNGLHSAQVTAWTEVDRRDPAVVDIFVPTTVTDYTFPMYLRSDVE